eukprot:TRINITY_DN1080_c1_g2_i1.p1 TRINITY_DN1080_c1_g2~~TRINITY_DN1080_c1_g2_i1.p1  ORF type:complete len:419 (+),score=67.24 TRINITY_DN1080_c1_g2_i1:27-1259(+)
MSEISRTDNLAEGIEPVSANHCYGFCFDSVVKRLPDILKSCLQQGTVTEDQVKEILGDIESDSELSLIKTGPEISLFNQPILQHKYTWKSAPWFFVESYFYRRLFDSIGYFENSKDPFVIGKQQSFVSSLEGGEQLALVVNTIISKESSTSIDSFRAVLLMCLWGNKADLSLNPDGVSSSQLLFALEADKDKILSDDTTLIWEYIMKLKDSKMDFVVDNAGLDVISDLCLATLLTSFGVVKNLVIHVKMNPIFVSDVTVPDMDYMIEQLKSRVDTHGNPTNLSKISILWKKYIESGSWTVKPDLFWNQYAPFWNLPDHIHDSFKASSLVLFKGDANYRRTHGDLRWPFETPTKDIVNYFPSPVLLIRTLKSETASGLTQDQVTRLNQTYGSSMSWLSNGSHGVIQFISTA